MPPAAKILTVYRSLQGVAQQFPLGYTKFRMLDAIRDPPSIGRIRLYLGAQEPLEDRGRQAGGMRECNRFSNGRRPLILRSRCHHSFACRESGSVCRCLVGRNVKSVAEITVGSYAFRAYSIITPT